MSPTLLIATSSALKRYSLGSLTAWLRPFSNSFAVIMVIFLLIILVRVSKHPNLRLHGLFRASHSHNPASIRIPVALSHHFILIEGRVINSISHRHASMPWKMSFDTVTNIRKNPAKYRLILFYLQFVFRP